MFIYDLNTYKTIKEINLDEEVLSISFSNDGKYIACGCNTHITIFEINTNKIVYKHVTYFENVDIDFYKSQYSFIFGGYSHFMSSNIKKKHFLILEDICYEGDIALNSIKICDNDRYLASGHCNKIKLWSLNTKPKVIYESRTNSYIYSKAIFTNDSDYLLYNNLNYIVAYSIKNKKIYNIDVINHEISDFTLSINEDLLLCISLNFEITLIEWKKYIKNN